MPFSVATIQHISHVMIVTHVSEIPGRKKAQKHIQTCNDNRQCTQSIQLIMYPRIMPISVLNDITHQPLCLTRPYNMSH